MKENRQLHRFDWGKMQKENHRRDGETQRFWASAIVWYHRSDVSDYERHRTSDHYASVQWSSGDVNLVIQIY